MDIDRFSKILKTFADTPDDVNIKRGELIVQIRDELIEARLENRAGSVHVIEGGVESPASTWIINRIARLPSLADRILSHVRGDEHFVSPSGMLLDYIEESELLDD